MSQVRKVKRGSRRKDQQELRTEDGKVGGKMQRRKASQVYSGTWIPEVRSAGLPFLADIVSVVFINCTHLRSLYASCKVRKNKMARGICHQEYERARQLGNARMAYGFLLLTANFNVKNGGGH